MGFQLTIAEGQEAGREFFFEQGSVVIGRTAECDVVLYDPGVSRRHARISLEGDGYVVEDMGSSNGTKLNGNVVRRAELADGDAISLGPVVFRFAFADAAAAEEPQPISESSTRLVSNRRRGASALAPADADDSMLNQLAHSQTQAMQVVRASNPRALSRPQPAALEPSDDDEPAPQPVRRGLTAAERARIRRESPGLAGSFKLFWLEASGPGRALMVLFVLALVLGGAGAAGYLLFWQNAGPPLPPEPTLLSRQPIPQSFGHGPNVDYPRTDEKAFQLDYTPPVDALVIVHFQSENISEGEVVLFVNGKDVDKVPADFGDTQERSSEIVIRPQFLKRGVPNSLVFDNLRNPKGTEDWRIWNVWVETIPLIIKSPKQLVLDAQERFDRGTLTFERRDVGAANRHHAWKDFREAWLMLEAHPDPKPELYLLARDQMRMAQQELDQRCRMLMLDFQREVSHSQWDKARSTLDFVKEYFPANDQPCPWRAEQLRSAYDL